MNKKILLIATLTMMCILSANAQIFDGFSKNKNISSVYVSKTLLKLAGGMDMDMGGIEVKSLINKLDGVEIYTSENASGIKELNAAKDKISSIKDYELLMKVNEDGDDVTFFVKQTNDVITDFVMFALEPNESTVIRIVGAFTMEDIQNIVKTMN